MEKLVRIEELPIDSLESNIRLLIHKAKKARDSSYAPFSEFYVGCSVLHENGDIGLGSNQENASFPSGLCAERVALFESSKNLGQNKVMEIAVYAESNKYMVPKVLVPCAGCLQVISDIQVRQKSPIKVYMWDGGEVVFCASDVSQFLPFHFELNKK
jgi:cytidine deaminase